MLRKNVSGQVLHFAGISASTGAALTGATFAYRRCIDGTFAAGGGAITEDTGLGFYKCALAQADTNGNDLGFFFTATGAIPVAINVLATNTDPSTDVTQTGDSFAIVKAGGTGDNVAIKAKTDTLPASPAAIGSAMTLTGAYDAAKTAATQASVDDLPTNAELATALGTIPPAPTPPSATIVADAVWDEALAGHVVAGSAGAGLFGASAAGDPWSTIVPGAYAPGTAGQKFGTVAVAGAGAIFWTYTLNNSATGLPLADADIWVSTDIAGMNVVASGRTNQSGVARFFLDAGQVYVWCQKSGFNFTNPTAEQVS
jgi:hypothetical protein